MSGMGKHSMRTTPPICFLFPFLLSPPTPYLAQVPVMSGQGYQGKHPNVKAHNSHGCRVTLGQLSWGGGVTHGWVWYIHVSSQRRQKKTRVLFVLIPERACVHLVFITCFSCPNSLSIHKWPYTSLFLIQNGHILLSKFLWPTRGSMRLNEEFGWTEKPEYAEPHIKIGHNVPVSRQIRTPYI